MDRIRVLLADDDERYLTALRAFLGADPGIAIVGAVTSGREAVAAYSVARPDVVVMDVRMPGLDGLDATRSIVHDHPEARVLMLTAHAGSEIEQASLAVGAARLVSKRNAPAELGEAIRALARRRGADASESPGARALHPEEPGRPPA